MGDEFGPLQIFDRRRTRIGLRMITEQASLNCGRIRPTGALCFPLVAATFIWGCAYSHSDTCYSVRYDAWKLNCFSQPPHESDEIVFELMGFQAPHADRDPGLSIGDDTVQLSKINEAFCREREWAEERMQDGEVEWKRTYRSARDDRHVVDVKARFDKGGNLINISLYSYLTPAAEAESSNAIYVILGKERLAFPCSKTLVDKAIGPPTSVDKRMQFP